MKYRKLGKTDISVSVVALGCWPFAGDATWGPQEDADSLATVDAALDMGVNFFDTAEGYGDGRSEEVLGKALSGRREKAVIATKASPANLAAPDLIKACENSLERLRTDYIDYYQIHWPNPKIDIAESMDAMEDLRRQGKVRAVGVCNFGGRDLADLLKVGWCETDQLSYSLIWRAVEFAIKPKCVENGIGVLCWGPLCEGLLTGKYAAPEDFPLSRRGTRYFSKNRPQTQHGEEGCEKDTFETIDRIRRIAHGIGASMTEVALAWPLYQTGVTAVLAGSRKPEQIRQNAPAGSLELSPNVLRELSEATDDLKNKLGPNQDMYLPAAKSRIR